MLGNTTNNGGGGGNDESVRMDAILADDGKSLVQIAEGKTKVILEIATIPDMVVIRSKDSITAFNAKRHNELVGKAQIANETTCSIFESLQQCGLRTHFIRKISDRDFLAKRCAMIPLEWVARRVATGSFLKRNPGVVEGFRFNPPKVEIFYKDDAADDPIWSEEQVLSWGITTSGMKIGRREIDLMKRVTRLIFVYLEKKWSRESCALIDMKVEFGLTIEGDVVLADVIDNDSWRIWPAGDRRLQLDKQFYRDLTEVTDDALLKLKENYAKVAEIVKRFIVPTRCRVVILLGSNVDGTYANAIAAKCHSLGIRTEQRITSAHKTTDTTLDIIAQYEGDNIPTVFIAVAGRSNGLGPVAAGNTTLPVINAPPLTAECVAQDIWSSIRMPSGLGCVTVLGADEAALAAAKTLSLVDDTLFGRILIQQLENFVKVSKWDAKAEEQNTATMREFEKKMTKTAAAATTGIATLH